MIRLLRAVAIRHYNTLTLEGREAVFVYLLKDNAKVSPWHDVPLLTDKRDVFNMVMEIP